VKEFLHTLLAGARSLLWLRPERKFRVRPAEHYFLLLLLLMLVSAGVQWLQTPAPKIWQIDGLQSDFASSMVVLLLSWGMSMALRLKVRAWSLAILLNAALLWLNIALPWLVSLDLSTHWLIALFLVWWTGIAITIANHVWADVTRVLRWCSALLLAHLCAAYWLLVPQTDYVRHDPSSAISLLDSERGLRAPVELEVSAEALMFDQPVMLDQSLSAIEPSKPGVPELFVLAFASDANEDVFRNEAEYIERLFKLRFGVRQRVLTLINNVNTVEHYPLATLSNLRAGLQGLSDRMDPEDVLFIYFTTHGAEHHELFVDLKPLPLDQITPVDLAQAIGDALIGFRVIAVSACYSGGFIDALRDPKAMVMSAARADRPSFGCGVDSDITFFGHAFLVDGLNLTRDFRAAFLMAKRLLTKREAAAGFQPSMPQIDVGSEILGALGAWSDRLPKEMPRLNFAPAEKRKSSAVIEPSATP